MAANEKVLEIIREAKEKQSKKLDLRYRMLTEIPKEVFELSNLTQLDLSYNQLKTVLSQKWEYLCSMMRTSKSTHGFHF